MSSNRNKITMCNVCGKVIRDNLLKRHMNSKHSNIGSTQDYREKHSQCVNLMVDSQCKADDENEIGTEILRLKSRVSY